MADEGLAAARALLEAAEAALGRPVAQRGGVVRRLVSREQEDALAGRSDVVRLDEEHVLITSGITVFAALYLQGLWEACRALGARLEIADVEGIETLRGFDGVVIAAGAGTARLLPSLPLRMVKGQVLTCRAPMGGVERSLIGKGYLVPSEQEGVCHFGATYERRFADEGPCMETAQRMLLPRMSLFPGAPFEVLACRAGVRVMHAHHYRPLWGSSGPALYHFTALGSRGLLYHALCAKILVQENAFFL
jgi:glycine/D-amino acid oxidase-like deaminating enzyme